MSKKVTYNELIEALAKKTGQNKQLSDDFVKHLIKLITDDLKEDESSSITNFGGFTVKNVSAREGKNPQTGEDITIPAHKRVAFSPYKALRETVNAPYAHFEPKIIEEEESTIAPISPVASAKKEEKSGSGFAYLSILIVLLLAIIAGWFFLDDLYPGSSDTDRAASQTEKPVVVPENQPQTLPEQPPQAVPDTDENQVPESSDEETNSNLTPANEAEEVARSENGYQPVYRPMSDDWYWDIAQKMYGDPMFWPLIFDENKTVNDDPDQLFAWRALTVPDMENQQSPTQADYQQLAKATQKVSEAYANHDKPEKAAEYARFSEAYQQKAGG